VLDDLKMIHERDAQDMLGIAEKQGGQLRYAFTLHGNNELKGAQHIVYGAMGGSALPALFVTSWPMAKVPLEIVRGYDVPLYVGSNTLFIASSFSGNTEETLEAIGQAEERGAKIAVITNGGRLKQLAEEKGYVLAVLPVAFPRISLWYSFRALLEILERADVLAGDFRPELEQTSQFLDATVASWRPDMATSKNMAKQIAQELMGKSIVLYSGPKLYPAAYKWKISCNENAKQIAWANQYPEFNHNEFTGWSKQPVSKPYAVIELRSSLEHPRIQKRFVVTERLLSGMRPAPTEVHVGGRTLLEQLVWSAALGDYVSIYLALLNGLNPASLELVDKLKQAL
jgi:glucose/mannose-6-phosphate isomerase